MQRICVIDNSTLVNLTKLQHLQIFRYLRFLFRSIYIPARIFQEYQAMLHYEPHRQYVIDQARLPGEGFFVYCNSYDTIALAVLETTKGIDPGEAEVAAQHKSLNSQLVLSDDQRFIDAIRISDRHIRVMGTIHLIALLDFNKIVKKPGDYLKALHHHSPFTSTQLLNAYLDVSTYPGIRISKKELNKRLSLKQLGLK